MPTPISFHSVLFLFLSDLAWAIPTTSSSTPSSNHHDIRATIPHTLKTTAATANTDIDTMPPLTTLTTILSYVGFIWWVVMALITTYGFMEILTKYNGPKHIPRSIKLDHNNNNEVIDNDELEGVTILRPIKGVDPELELCLESALLQRYPASKVQVLFCVEDVNDPAVSIIEKLIERYGDSKDVQLLIDDEEDYSKSHFGPNPKINNLSKGFKAAKFDIVWIIDSNVWVSPGTLCRSVYSLKNSTDNGIVTTNRPVRLVHHIPLALSINSEGNTDLGAKLDEMFLHTSHAKFYSFFNKASFAPCVNGKSNMYRISELDRAVNAISKGQNKIINNSPNIAIDAANYINHNEGIRFFAKYIGEDNMIGIALWEMGGRTGMTGDVVCQPLGSGSGLGSVTRNGIMDYVNRRVRWLRVRKYMVLAATLLEPTTESVVVGIFGSYGISNLWFKGRYMWLLLLFHECVWCLTDYVQSAVLMTYSGKDLLKEYDAPFFMNCGDEKLQLINWLPIWILREALALPIWIIAMCGQEIDWRNRPFKIRADLSAEEL